MGAWGSGIFENDIALDWICDLTPPKRYLFGLLKSDPISRCLDSVQAVIDTEYVDADDACELLAAAECVALVRGHPAHNLPEEVVSWHTLIAGLKTSAKDDEINQWVLEAVERVKNADESELRILWADSEDYQHWLAEINDLLERLRKDPA